MKTSTKENGLEVKVGLFLCVGLLIIAAMILQFGLGGKQGIFKKYYTLVVDLPGADGLLKNSQVVLGGARVGYVDAKPVLAKNLNSVRVTIKVDDAIKIPIGSRFEVGTSGLLGDKYVTIETGPDFDVNKFDPNDAKQIYQPVSDPAQPLLKIYDPSKPEVKYEAGDAILGETAPGIPEVVKKLTDLADHAQKVVTSIETGVLSPKSQTDLQDTFAYLRDFSKSLPPIGRSAEDAVAKADQTVDKANQTMGTLHDTVEGLRQFIDKASHGEGLVAQLLNNRQLADNFSALVTNLKEHGLVFYHDTADKKSGQPSPTPRDKRQR